MKRNLFILVLVSFFFSVSAFAAPVTVQMDITVNPAVLGSNVISILIFDGPDIKTFSLNGKVVLDADSKEPQIGSLVNNWCKNDDVCTFWVANQKATYRVGMILASFSGTLDAWIIGADSPALGQDFQILPTGQIIVVKQAPSVGLSIQPVKALSVRSTGKLISTWGSLKRASVE